MTAYAIRKFIASLAGSCVWTVTGAKRAFPRKLSIPTTTPAGIPATRLPGAHDPRRVNCTIRDAVAMARANRAALAIVHVVVPFTPIVPEQYVDARTWERIDREARRWSLADFSGTLYQIHGEQHEGNCHHRNRDMHRVGRRCPARRERLT